ncbi:hypothetical protein HPB48_005556 [Haemaphysalis longicornis]|uniref:Uncharacterized protein n=1 Tax=Haemaphysalis longicornis TaxID=44386 RepID=A0A9J6H511_HAELO|nr:hypothetical protein HPB48_005556 [Haemaphysalis longicornis]
MDGVRWQVALTVQSTYQQATQLCDQCIVEKNFNGMKPATATCWKTQRGEVLFVTFCGLVTVGVLTISFNNLHVFSTILIKQFHRRIWEMDARMGLTPSHREVFPGASLLAHPWCKWDCGWTRLQAPATVMVRTTLGPSGGAPFQGAPDMVDGLSRVSKMAEEDPVQRRLRTFDSWPPNAPVPKERLALGGFVHDGGLRTKCLSCGVVISDWRVADVVIQRHREASPNSRLRRRKDLPSEAPARRPLGMFRGRCRLTVRCLHRRRMNESLFLQRLKASEEARFETFYDWPLVFLPPRRMAEAGFYYFHESDRVRCAFCRGVVHGWEPGDDPLREHARHYPCCPFLLNPEVGRGRDECGHESWQRGRSRPEGERAALLASNGGPNVHLKAPMAHLTKLGVAAHTGPKHPSQASPDARLRSFDKWPATCPKRPPELVKAGFFYIGLQDYTKCFHCDGGLCNWDASDDPWEEHARWFPRCQFVLLNKGEAFIEQCLQRHRSHLNSVAASTSTGPSSDEDAGMSTELAALMQSEDVQFYLSQGVPAETLRAALLRHMRAQNRGFGSRDELLQVLSELLTLPRRVERG